MRTGLIAGLSKSQTVALVTAVGVGLAGLIAVLEYFNSRKHKEILRKNAELENQIKQLQLLKLSSDLDGDV